ncbi:transposase [Roseivirga sp. E12]|uniref:REP-associated tyrosine transposase n=1 Tax=Roseivirga sp. E12 TaxID=2819237 RepID=UPI001ABC2A87|nr:transposase [Roseivirga sp. E12]MBO3698268.1 transposase [Roseivirga sp. E12]
MGLRNRYLVKNEQTFFVTTTCNGHKRLIELSKAYDLICESLTFVSLKYNCAILAYVIMPNHLHLILHFKVENRISDYMRDFKKFTATKIRQGLEAQGLTKVIEDIRIQMPNRVFKVWEQRFHEKPIDSKGMLEEVLDYIHSNPLQAQWTMVEYPEDYTYSSALFYEKGRDQGLEVSHYLDYF